MLISSTMPEGRVKIFSWRFFFGVGLTVLISYVLLRQVSLGHIERAFLTLKAESVLVAVILLIATTILKAWRFAVLLSRAVSARALVPVVLLHNVFINFLPSRSGELAYPYLLKRRHGISVTQSLPSLVIGRVFDVLVILLLIAASLVLVPTSLGVVAALLPEIGLGIAGLLGVFFLLTYRAEWLHRVLEGFFIRRNLYKIVFFGPLLKRLMELLRAFTTRHSHSQLAAIAVVTVVIWLLTFGFEFVLYRGLGLPVSYGQFVIAFLFPILTHIVPVQSFAAIGTYEATITGGFVLLGFSAPQVIPLTFTVHIIQLVMTLLFGAFGWWLYRQDRWSSR